MAKIIISESELNNMVYDSVNKLLKESTLSSLYRNRDGNRMMSTNNGANNDTNGLVNYLYNEIDNVVEEVSQKYSEHMSEPGFTEILMRKVAITMLTRVSNYLKNK